MQSIDYLQVLDVITYINVSDVCLISCKYSYVYVTCMLSTMDCKLHLFEL